MPRKKTCRNPRCDEPPTVGGLCQTHFEESERKHRRYMEAADVLHTGRIDGTAIGPGPLGDEFLRVQHWWFEICSAVNAGREHPILKDETQCGTDWCIAIAQDLIDAERERRAGTGGDSEQRQYIRQLTWSRFENLEKGLMSNGIPRPANRRS